MKKKLLKYTLLVLFVYGLTNLITPFNTYLRNRSIINQINYLSTKLNEGYDDELQNKFPEGKVFSNAILALSIIEYCDQNLNPDTKYAVIVDKCITRLLSEKTLSHFNPSVFPEYGIFYNGWTNYVFNKYKNSRLFEFSNIRDKVLLKSEIIEKRIENTLSDSIRILETYPGLSWPADNFIGLISLESDSIRELWLEMLINSTEHPSGLVGHYGGTEPTIRGSSGALITFCLAEIDNENINEYYTRYKEIFIDDIFGIQLVSENEDKTNEMDFDSGPVLFGYGASATIMNIKTQVTLHDRKSMNTWAFMNFNALPVNIFNRKYYLFQEEPMFDLFMLWACVEMK